MITSLIWNLLMVLSLSDSPSIYAAARCDHSNDTMDVPLIVSYHLRKGKRSPLLINDNSDTLAEDEERQTETRVPCVHESTSFAPTFSSTPRPSSTEVSPTPSPTTHRVATTTEVPSLFPTKSDSPSTYDHRPLPRDVDEGKGPTTLEADEPERFGGVLGAIFFIALASVMTISLFVSPKFDFSDEESQNTSPTDTTPPTTM